MKTKIYLIILTVILIAQTVYIAFQNELAHQLQNELAHQLQEEARICKETIHVLEKNINLKDESITVSNEYISTLKYSVHLRDSIITNLNNYLSDCYQISYTKPK